MDRYNDHYKNSYSSNYNVSASYSITILNDTEYPKEIIWTGWFCGGIGTGRPVGQCTNPTTVYPGQTISHRYRFTQYEGVLIYNKGLWCAFPLTSELSNIVILLSDVLNIIEEEAAKGNYLCSRYMPESWYGTILGTMSTLAASAVAMASIIYKLNQPPLTQQPEELKSSPVVFIPKEDQPHDTLSQLGVTNYWKVGEGGGVQTTALSVLGFPDDHCATAFEIKRSIDQKTNDKSVTGNVRSVIYKAQNVLSKLGYKNRIFDYRWCVRNFRQFVY